jgi:hypothetical protein
MMTYLALHRPAATVHLTGREIRRIAELAQAALVAELSLPGYQRLRGQLELPPVSSRFFESQVLELMADGEPRHIAGCDVDLSGLALNILYQQQPAAGILCWLYGNALARGWVADADREAMAGQIQAALDGGAARARAADRYQPAVEVSGFTIPPGNRDGWEDVIAFLRAGTGDIVTSLSIGNEFPDCRLAWDSGIWRPDIPDPRQPGEELEILWDKISAARQWDLCMQALYARPWLQWKPAVGYRFGEFTLDPHAGLVPFAAEAVKTGEQED